MPAINRCTAQRSSGDFCDAPSLEDMPFPICLKHAGRVFTAMSQTIMGGRSNYVKSPPAAVARTPDPGVVYYIRMADDRIKIGHTTRLKGRLREFCALPEQVLAVEPGTPSTEAARHREYQEDRLTGERELFRTSPQLTAHIDRLSTEYADLRATHMRRS